MLGELAIELSVSNASNNLPTLFGMPHLARWRSWFEFLDGICPARPMPCQPRMGPGPRWSWPQASPRRCRPVKAFKLMNNIRTSLWFVPVLCVLLGAALSFGTIALDRYFDYELVPEQLVGGPDAAMTILATVAASMVSLAALVLTITMVVVQLAMGQFSPRIVQRILRDKPSQLAIGLFVATFVHAILAVREVINNGDGTGQVPGIAIVTAFVLVLVSIAVLVVYVHHIGQALRVSALIELVGKETASSSIASTRTRVQRSSQIRALPRS